MKGDPKQLIGRQVWVIDNGEGRWRVYPALVMSVREREGGYGPYEGLALLAWVRADGLLKVDEQFHVNTRFRFSNHGWFYREDELNERGRAWLAEEKAWPEPLAWKPLPERFADEE